MSTDSRTSVSRPSKETLLKELQSIHASLEGQPTASCLPKNISNAPTEDLTPQESSPLDAKVYIQDSTAHTNPPEFSYRHSSNHVASDKAAIIEGENPFLPTHIRERLQRQKANVVEELAAVGAALNGERSTQASTAIQQSASQEASSTPTDNPAPQQTRDKILTEEKKDIHRYIDQIVAKYLPILEAELRESLKSYIQNTAPQSVTAALQGEKYRYNSSPVTPNADSASSSSDNT